MESPTRESSVSQVPDVVVKTQKTLDATIQDMNVPVEQATRMAEVGGALTSSQLGHVREALDAKIDPLTKTLKVSGLVADVAIGVACGVGSVVFGRDMAKATKGLERTKISKLAHLGRIVAPDLEKMRSVAKRNTLVMGGLSGAVLALRPVSRLIYMFAPGHPEPMRIEEVMNAMKLRR